jgi:hypothetical protein
VAGRFADRFTVSVLVGGTAIPASALTIIAAIAGDAFSGTGAFPVVGLVGVYLNPAMVARVMRAPEPGPLVNTLHAGDHRWARLRGPGGGVVIDEGFGLTAPLWVGSGLVLLALLSLAPSRARLDKKAETGRPTVTARSRRLFRLSVAAALPPAVLAPAAATA